MFLSAHSWHIALAEELENARVGKRAFQGDFQPRGIIWRGNYATSSSFLHLTLRQRSLSFLTEFPCHYVRARREFIVPGQSREGKADREGESIIGAIVDDYYSRGDVR